MLVSSSLKTRFCTLKPTFKHIAGNSKMPDAMEIIFQAALEFGKSGAVSKPSIFPLLSNPCSKMI